MKPYVAVIYDFGNKSNVSVVTRDWIFPKDELIDIGERRYIYYHSDLTSKPLRGNIANLLHTNDKTKIEGKIYPGIVLTDFGKVSYLIFMIFTNLRHFRYIIASWNLR
jgi:hypothetical protein